MTRTKRREYRVTLMVDARDMHHLPPESVLLVEEMTPAGWTRRVTDAAQVDAEDAADAEQTRALWESRTDTVGGSDKGFVKVVMNASEPRREA